MIPTLLVLFLLLGLFYARFVISAFVGLKKTTPPKNIKAIDEFVSIIIPFRNESENILKNLESIQKQNYPKDKYEILYIDDSSDDDSYAKLTSAIKDSNICVLQAPKDFSVRAHKKRAIRYGITQAKGDVIVSSDADCLYEETWLSTLLSCYDEKTAFVSGPVKFFYSDTLFGEMQRLEFAGLVILGGGLIGYGKPTTCNAANLSYRRKVYDEVGGFMDNLNLSSGDDEMLMQKIHKDTDWKIVFCPDKKAMVRTEANRTVKQFYNQRKRWASKGLFYADNTLIFSLILIFFYYLSMPVQLLLGLFCDPVFLLSGLICFLFKFAPEYFLMREGLRKIFQDKMKNGIFALVEILHVPYIIIAGAAGSLGGFKWKERKVGR
jgi:cellulose synthase/poly-beta-1,6-N-acetylglucosamine synthase-like glycosyltransferase